MKKNFLFLLLLLLLGGTSLFYFRDKIMLYLFYSRAGKTIEDRLNILRGNTFTRGMVYTGDYIYVSTLSHLLILQARFSNDLSLVKKIRLPGMIASLAKEDNTLYVCTKIGGVYVLDISAPEKPKIVSKIEATDVGFVKNALAHKGFLYLSTESGLIVADVHRKQHPKVTARILSGAAGEIEIAQDKLFVTEPAKGLLIFDIRNPDAPAQIGEVNLYHPSAGKPLPSDIPPTGVAVVGNKAYVTNGYQGVAVVDVSDAQHPLLLRHIRLQNYCDGILHIGSYLVVNMFPNLLAFVNIKNPDRPVTEKTMKGFGFMREGFYKNKAVFVENSSRLSLLDVRHLLSPKVLSSYGMKSAAYAVKADDYYVYVAQGSEGLKMYRRTPQDNPVLLSKIRTSGTATDIAVDGDDVFVSNGVQGGIDVLDVIHPEKPVKKINFNAEQMTEGITLHDATLFAATGDRIFTLYDITHPETPAFLSQTAEPSDNRNIPLVINVFVEKPYLYGLGLSNGIFMGKIRSSRKIVNIEKIQVEARDMAIKDGIAYLASYEKGIQLLDVRDPLNAKLLSSFPTEGFAMAVDIKGTSLYVADYKKGVFVFDIRIPAELKPVAFYATRGHPRSVDAIGNFCYVADGEAGLATLNVTTGQILYADDADKP